MLSFFNSYNYSQNWDYLDVEPGYETLNIAIEGDTTSTGEPISLNRAYRLQRDGVYLYNGSITNLSGSTMRIVASEGTGKLPLIIPVADQTGSSRRFFLARGNGYFENLAISGVDNLGNVVSEGNMFRLASSDIKLTIKGCFLDYDLQSFIRMNSSNQSVFVINSVLRNSTNPVSTGNGRFIDTRGNPQDTISVKNSTLYITSQNIIRGKGSLINQFILDHVTIFGGNGINAGYSGIVSKTDGIIEIMRSINCQITNNLFIDCGFEGGENSPSDPADTVKAPIIPIDSLRTDDPSKELNRVWDIRNNVYGWSPSLETWFSSTDSSYTPVFLNVYADELFNLYPTMKASNNVREFVQFTDPPSSEALAAFAQHKQATGNSDIDNPIITADKNGLAALQDDPNSFGPAENEFDFKYNTNSQAYTFAEGGLPAGDLNPWGIDYSTTGIEENYKYSIPAEFSLSQNYPNPFNPSTMIEYTVPFTSNITLSVYNVLGQEVVRLIDNKLQATGQYTISWDTSNGSSKSLSSGIYIYQLRTEGMTISKKMILLK